ncbi:2-hydroxyacid dehydrogenase [Maribacter cobaltidurans]|uniref:Glyoxylate/hydroxypyruvate reductase B n=1 Tax=Maribacter cobaltidurans TaxID=1178778 RepID=A0A223V3D7_9FLAO|nr:D-glycerate dehydrogenase [Maribacter cobaltidurans]ASV29757.1 D-glycerate dehydrogenase [Maribacter cobaltidurans]GGD92809.1 D-glycerate dehydrogenase [Maribacter cobaltidurans]
MKVLVSLNFPPLCIEMLKKEGLDVTVWTNDIPMTREQLIQATQEHDILLSSSIYALDADFLERNKHLKLISQFAVGYNNIDLKKAAELGIPVTNTPNAMTDATADIAFGLMLAVSRKMFYMHKTIISGNWGHFRPQANLGMELKGKTVGIFGMGRIGSEFAKRCRGAYDMKVIYHNRTPNPEMEKELNASYVSFEELLKQSDVLSVHAGLSNETKGLFNADAFSKMKPSAIFINTARGGIHNEKSLIEALQSHLIWGAGLDVTNPEPMKKDNPLLNMENVAVTPHIGSATVEARNEMSRLAALNIIQFSKGEPLTNLVR